MKNIQILLADDHEVVRFGFRRLLDGAPDLSVIAETASGEQACSYYLEYHPDVVVMDLSMPGIGGLEAARDFLDFLKSPEAQVIFERAGFIPATEDELNTTIPVP